MSKIGTYVLELLEDNQCEELDELNEIRGVVENLEKEN